MKKKFIAYLNIENMSMEDAAEKACALADAGADEILLSDYSIDEKEHERFLEAARFVVRNTDVAVITAYSISRFEDGKKAFYTGANAVAIREEDEAAMSLYKELTDRFGVNRILILKHQDSSMANMSDGKLGIVLAGSDVEEAADRLNSDAIIGIAADFSEKPSEIMACKKSLKSKGIEMDTFESAMRFDELTVNADGLIPVIVQDYVTNEVLMLAYMNEEAFSKTVETGVMTYYSRSRQQLWLKGETSGHYQYVKSLSADCDNDTILARVHQIGAACHTGSYSCFFKELVKHEYREKEPYKILSALYETAVDRKKNPKEGSYTNYLYDKGLDKILKKCGEEATEIVIAAKNPNATELKYEIADFLYHMTVLMVECGVDWEDITDELANRH